jgi:hypothetical protein
MRVNAQTPEYDPYRSYTDKLGEAGMVDFNVKAADGGAAL